MKNEPAKMTIEKGLRQQKFAARFIYSASKFVPSDLSDELDRKEISFWREKLSVHTLIRD